CNKVKFVFSSAYLNLLIKVNLIEDIFTSTAESRIWDLSPMRLGSRKRRQGIRRHRRARKISSGRSLPTHPLSEEPFATAHCRGLSLSRSGALSRAPVEYLTHRREFIPTVARWHHTEWPSR